MLVLGLHVLPLNLFVRDYSNPLDGQAAPGEKYYEGLGHIHCVRDEKLTQTLFSPTPLQKLHRELKKVQTSASIFETKQPIENLKQTPGVPMCYLLFTQIFSPCLPRLCMGSKSAKFCMKFGF